MLRLSTGPSLAQVKYSFEDTKSLRAFSAAEGASNTDPRHTTRPNSNSLKLTGRAEVTGGRAGDGCAPQPPGAGYRASTGSRSGLPSAFRNCAQASAHCQLPSEPLPEMPRHENLFRDTFVDVLFLQGMAADPLQDLHLQEARAFAPAGVREYLEDMLLPTRQVRPAPVTAVGASKHLPPLHRSLICGQMGEHNPPHMSLPASCSRLACQLWLPPAISLCPVPCRERPLCAQVPVDWP